MEKFIVSKAKKIDASIQLKTILCQTGTRAIVN